MTLQFCIERGMLGSTEHFSFVDGKGSWTDTIPDETWVLASTPRKEFCLQTLLRLNGIELNTSVPSKHIRTMELTMKDTYSYDRVPWRHVVPSREYKSFFMSLLQNVRSAARAVDPTYYTETFSRVTPLFEGLEHAAINVPKLEEYLANPKTSNPHTLKSFKPIAGSFARRVEYDRFGARTGRLTMKNGPDILTLKKDYRDVITSRFQKGTIKYVDFSSLEARVMMTVAGEKVDVKDIYTKIGRQLGLTKSRKIVKLIVIATIYGSGTGDLQRLAGISERQMLETQDKIREMFKVDALRIRLSEEWHRLDGKIRNAYGRMVITPDESTLINSYVQSTAVDVALLGFWEFVQDMRQRELKSRPIFILHDAILIDTHPSEELTIDEMVGNGVKVTGMSNTFFLDASDI